jgi:hypothetical protein
MARLNEVAQHYTTTLQLLDGTLFTFGSNTLVVLMVGHELHADNQLSVLPHVRVEP